MFENFSFATACLHGHVKKTMRWGNQDALGTAEDKDSGVKVWVACDGCTGKHWDEVLKKTVASHCEIGAKYGAEKAPVIIAKAFAALKKGDEGDVEKMRAVWAQITIDLQKEIKALIESFVKSPDEADFIDALVDIALFTVIGVVLTAENATFFHLGDGVFSVNGVTTVIKYKGNAPNYLAYGLCEAEEGEAEENANPTFTVAHVEPIKSLKEFFVGTDGLNDLISASNDESMEWQESLKWDPKRRYGVTRQPLPFHRSFWNDEHTFVGGKLEKALLDSLAVEKRNMDDDTAFILGRRTGVDERAAATDVVATVTEDKNASIKKVKAIGSKVKGASAKKVKAIGTKVKVAAAKKVKAIGTKVESASPKEKKAGRTYFRLPDTQVTFVHGAITDQLDGIMTRIMTAVVRTEEMIAFPARNFRPRLGKSYRVAVTAKSAEAPHGWAWPLDIESLDPDELLPFEEIALVRLSFGSLCGKRLVTYCKRTGTAIVVNKKSAVLRDVEYTATLAMLPDGRYEATPVDDKDLEDDNRESFIATEVARLKKEGTGS